MARTSIALTAALCLMPALAAAQQMPDRETLRQYCTGDYLTHCSVYAPDTPEVEACFRVNARLMSPNCSAAIAQYQRTQGKVRKVSAAR